MIPKLLAAGLFAACIALGVPPEPASAAEMDELLVAVRLDDRQLADAMPARAAGQRLFLPLGQLASALSLAIDVDVQARTAEGFVATERRRFALRVDAGRAIVGTDIHDLAPDDVVVGDDDLYVPAGLLEAWLGLTLDYQPLDALVRVSSPEKLPIQAHWERERIAGLLAASRDEELAGPTLAVPFAMFDGPFVDHVLRLESGPARGFAVDHSTHVTAELLGLEAEGFVSGLDNDFVTQRRLTIGRRSAEGGLLGPLDAREVLVGDVLDGGLNLVMRPRSGLGLRLGSFPLAAPDRFGVESLRGALPSGWQVELYQDGALVDLRTAGADEQYEFLEIPLHFGANELELVFHGPRGEIREEVIHRHVGRSLVPEGDLAWRLTSVRAEDGHRQSAAVADFGVSRLMTISSGAAVVETDEGTRRYLTGGLRASAGRILGNLDVAADVSGGWAAEIALQSRVGVADLSFRHAEMRGFATSFFSRTSPVARRSELRMDALLPVERLRALPLSIALENETLESGESALRLKARLAASGTRTFVSFEAAWRQADAGFGGDEATGRFLVRRRFDGFALRGELACALDSFDVERVSIGGEAIVADDWFVRGDVTQDFLADDARYAVSVERSLRFIGVGGELSWSDDGLTVAVTLRTGLAHDRHSGRWHAQAQPLAAAGAVSALAFLDLDGDGARDDDEPAVAGAAVRAGRGVGATTGEDGACFLASVPAHRLVAVALDPTTLDDPLALPMPQVLKIEPRPGRVARIELPVVLTGDIAGTVTVDESGLERPVGGATVQLVDERGHVALETISAFDGFYNLTRIVPGRYVVRAAPRPGPRLAGFTDEIRLDVPPSGLVRDGLDLRLAPAPDGPVPMLAQFVTPPSTAMADAWSALPPTLEESLEGLLGAGPWIVGSGLAASVATSVGEAPLDAAPHGGL